MELLMQLPLGTFYGHAVLFNSYGYTCWHLYWHSSNSRHNCFSLYFLPNVAQQFPASSLTPGLLACHYTFRCGYNRYSEASGDTRNLSSLDVDSQPGFADAL